jgi:SNF2 family DNA or RNA helicase
MSAVQAEIFEGDETKIRLTYEWRFAELMKTIPSAKILPGSNNQANVYLSWQSYLAVYHTFGMIEEGLLEIGPKLEAWVMKEWTERIGVLMQIRDTLESPGYPDLRPHQNAGVNFLSLAERGFLCDDMGTGKTRTTFSTVRRLHEMGQNPFPVLVSAPNSTKIGWQREIDIVWPGLKVNVVTGSAGQRRKLLEEKAHVYIINHEIAKTHSRLAPYPGMGMKRCKACGGQDSGVKETACQVHIRELNMIDFNTVIIDEVHRIKDPKSQISRALKAASGNARFRFGLSGTPIASKPYDLYSALNWLWPEVYTSRKTWRERFMDISYDAWGNPVVLGVSMHREKEFFAGLDPFLRRMPKDVILPYLPPVVRDRRDVEMSPKQAKAYKQMESQMLAELNGDLIVTDSPLTRMMRLLQFSSSYAEVIETDEVVFNPYTQQDERKQQVVLTDPSATLDAFMDDIEDFGEESVVVFAVSRQLIDLLAKRLDKAKIKYGLITGAQTAIERQIHMDDFQAGKTKFILCTIAAGGTGITLTQGSITAFLQRSWSMIENLQAEARTLRIGSEIHDRIRIIDYVTMNTVQNKVFEAMEEKSRNLQLILRDDDLVAKVLKGEEITAEEFEAVEGDDIENPEEEIYGDDS